jgi:long-chain fatty acid transport protein
MIYRPEESDWTFGLGMFSIGGFSANYPASQTNPILTAQPPRGIGVGALSSQLQILQIAPTVAYHLSEHLSLGFAATTDMTYLIADPAFIAAPDGSASPTFPTLGAATHSRFTWGQGFQAGIYYTTCAGWNFGASIKSPQWTEPFRYFTQDQLGRPRTIKFHFDVPMVASVGTSYTGFQGWVLAADFRYVDFHNTEGLRQSGFGPDGAVRGLGWDNVFAMSLGAQYQVTDCLSARLGYTFNTDPIPESKTSFNIASSTIIQHSVSVGFSYSFTPCLSVSLTYIHDFENSISGPVISRLGPIPGSSVKSEVEADGLLVGARLKF